MKEIVEPSLSENLGVTIRLRDCCFAYEDMALDAFGRALCMADDDGAYFFYCVEQRKLKYRVELQTELEVRGGPDGCFVVRDVDGQEHLLTFYFRPNQSEMSPLTPGEVAAHLIQQAKVQAMGEEERAHYEKNEAIAWDRWRAERMKEKFDGQRYDACQQRCKAEAKEMMQQHGIAQPLPPAKTKRKPRRATAD